MISSRVTTSSASQELYGRALEYFFFICIPHVLKIRVSTSIWKEINVKQQIHPT